MGEDFARPKEGFTYVFAGMKTNARADQMPPGKYPLAVNIRGRNENSVLTRPGQAARFSGGSAIFLDLRAYSALNTDNLPRILAYDALSNVWLDNSVNVGTVGYFGLPPLGASMIPFRPAESPTPWMYIANGREYQKFSAPTASNVVTQQKVGIAEPQTPPEAIISAFKSLTITAGTTTPTGTAGSVTYSYNGRINDTAGAVLQDPISGSILYAVQVSASFSYQRNMYLGFNPVTGGIGLLNVVLDVFAGLPTPLTMSAIYYFSGTTGRCIIVPANQASGPGVDTSIYSSSYLTTLRRGSLIEIDSEICYVWSVSSGPDGTVSIETSTTTNHTPSGSPQITFPPSILVSPFIGSGPPVTGYHIFAESFSCAVSAGIGLVTTPAGGGFNPFVYAALGISSQPEDYVSFGFFVDAIANLNEVKLLLDVGDGSFTQNFYYYTIRPSDIEAAVTNSVTQVGVAQTVAQLATVDEEIAAMANNQGTTGSSAQLSPGNSQWTQFIIPISEFTRVGSNQTKTLQSYNSIQVLINANNSVNIAFDRGMTLGQYQPDVGDVGAPYTYRVRPRSSITGAVGNPSPDTRYGVSPRRMQITLKLPSAAYDSQIDTWDIFRYGGTVTEWRFVGSTPSTNSSFTDNYEDDAVQAGNALDFDNFEPWPSIYTPLTATANVTGTTAVVTITSPTDLGNALDFLPGNLVQIGGANVYTLRTRPSLLSSSTCLMQFEENAGAATAAALSIYEPAIANQPLPYLWGPDAAGTVFAVGDLLRPGTLYFAKNYAPDSAPDTYNIEITPPSEPLLGGETLDGLSFVASTEHWWALYPQAGNASQRYAIVQQPFPRGLAAPFGTCTDGKVIYWWAKDGIYASDRGSLTDADLYNIFPHEGVIGSKYSYGITEIPAPDYSRAGTFRLAWKNSYLYATYQDSTETYYTLVCDLRRTAWSLDIYSPAVTVIYAPEQQAGTLLSSGTRYDELLMATLGPQVVAQADATNDISAAITCQLASAEFDGGDTRAPKQWGDVFLDATPAAQGSSLKLTLESQGAPITLTAITVPLSATRVRQALSVGGYLASDFLGVLAIWTDDFTKQTVPTVLYEWQPSFVVQPARTITWTTLGTSFGINGYMHIREVELAWISTTPITLAIASYDGQSPQNVVLPSSSGAYVKQLFPLTANKGHLYAFAASSSAPFQLFLDDSEIRVGAWGRQGPYAVERKFAGATTDAGSI
jgi:hypothetical protein